MYYEIRADDKQYVVWGKQDSWGFPLLSLKEAKTLRRYFLQREQRRPAVDCPQQKVLPIFYDNEQVWPRP